MQHEIETEQTRHGQVSRDQAPADRTCEFVFVALDLTGEETVLVEKLVVPADSAEKRQ